jgi:hypothetical protein
MADKMAKYLLIGIFLVGVLAGAGGYSLFHKCPEITNKQTAVKVEEKTDTSTAKHELAVISPAKTRYTPVPASVNPQDSPQSPTGEGPLEKISYYDTTSADGFEAHINYYHNQDLFLNRFVIPERTITKEKTITVTETQTVTIRELPKWEIGIGIKTWYQESKFNYYPFASLTFNQKVLFFNTSLEFRGNANFDNGHVSLAPEVEGKLKVGL